MKLNKALKEFRYEERIQNKLDEIISDANRKVKELKGPWWILKAVSLISGVMAFVAFSPLVLVFIFLYLFSNAMEDTKDIWHQEESNEAKRKLKFLKKKGLIK